MLQKTFSDTVSSWIELRWRIASILSLAATLTGNARSVMTLRLRIIKRDPARWDHRMILSPWLTINCVSEGCEGWGWPIRVSCRRWHPATQTRRRSWSVCNSFFLSFLFFFVLVHPEINMYYRRKSGRLYQENLDRLIWADLIKRFLPFYKKKKISCSKQRR